MSTQEERRQAIGQTMTAERQAIGQRIRDDLNRSLMPERKQKLLPELPAKGALGVQVGVGAWKGCGAAAGGGGIASPLTEKTVTVDGKTVPDREYWPGLTSSDGLFILPAIKTLNLTGANGAEVIVELASPVGAA
jgi:hypothetical protein